MIDEEIKIIINDILCHTKEMIKFLRSIKTGKYNAYLDDLIDFALCTEEDIQTIEHYIYELEIKLYDALNGGDVSWVINITNTIKNIWLCLIEKI